MYATYDFYKTTYGGNLDEETATKALDQSSRHIDSLTYNRINGVGFNSLTPFQQNVIQTACCMMADFETENENALNVMLSSYSLNGASMSFSGESASATVVNGVTVKRETYDYLKQCGLCCRSVRGWAQ